MNSDRFDLFARRFATAANRRALFKAALTALVFDAFGGLGRSLSVRRPALAVAPRTSSHQSRLRDPVHQPSRLPQQA